jgi:hypothetical protein
MRTLIPAYDVDPLVCRGEDGSKKRALLAMFDEQIFAEAYTTSIELWMELALQAFARSLRGCVALLLALSGFALARPVVASDHQDTLYLATDRPGADLTDVFVFPAADPNKVVLAMDVHPLIPTGMGMSASFDPGVMYQFHIAHDAGLDAVRAADLTQGSGRSSCKEATPWWM